MISTEAHVKKDVNWDAKSVDHGTTVSNKETSMTFGEHQRIALAAKQIMATFNWQAVQKTWTSENGKEAAKHFALLKECYESEKTHAAMTIVKGIHQPYGNPHLTVSVKKGNTKGVSFHLNVSATEYEGVEGRGLEGSFQWKGTQFSCEVGGTTFRWPASASVNKKRRGGLRRGGLQRTNSISAIDIVSLNKDFDAAVAKQRLAAEAERKAKETAEAEKKAEEANKIVGQTRGAAFEALIIAFGDANPTTKMPFVGKSKKIQAFETPGTSVIVQGNWKLSFDGSAFSLTK